MTHAPCFVLTTMIIKQAVILAGGRGERLRPLTDEIPKPLAPVNGIPFLDYLIHSIREAGIERVVMLLGYKAEMVMHRYGSSKLGIQFSYSVGSVDDQTGRRLFNAYHLLDEYFMFLYSDNYWPIELNDMLRLYETKRAKALTTVFSNKNGTSEYGKENNVEVEEDSFVRRYDKKRTSTDLNGVDIGYFLVAKNVLDPKRAGNVSFEEDLLPEFIARRELVAYVTDTQYYYITSLQSLKNFEVAVKQNRIQSIKIGDSTGIVE